MRDRQQAAWDTLDRGTRAAERFKKNIGMRLCDGYFNRIGKQYRKRNHFHSYLTETKRLVLKSKKVCSCSNRCVNNFVVLRPPSRTILLVSRVSKQCLWVEVDTFLLESDTKQYFFKHDQKPAWWDFQFDTISLCLISLLTFKSFYFFCSFIVFFFVGKIVLFSLWSQNLYDFGQVKSDQGVRGVRESLVPFFDFLASISMAVYGKWFRFH